MTDNTRFVCIRGGNVLGTNGSVVPLFIEQIKKNNEITLTDDEMTRFFLTLKEAITLVFQSAVDSYGGEAFVLKMPAAKIIDLAEVVIEECGDDFTKIRKIGVRPGEKTHEVLVSRYESPRTIDRDDYYIILPHINISRLLDKYTHEPKIKLSEFNSLNARQLSKEDIRKMLATEGWLSNKPDLGIIGKIDAESLKFKEEKWL